MKNNDIAGGASPLKKSLPIFFLIDVSGSMGGERIAAVNEAMDKIVPEFKRVASNYPLIDFNVRVITYGDGQANWKIGDKKKGVPVNEQFGWFAISESEVDGGTPADMAMDLLSSVTNDREYLGGYVGTPMALIISDGCSNGRVPFFTAVDQFRATKFGDLFIQVAIGIGTENDQRATDELKYFGKNGFRHCTDDPEKIVELIGLATINSLKKGVEGSLKTKKAVDDDPYIF